MSEPKKKTVMPRKKGGTVFPRIDLEQAVKYAMKLVSKTHIGAQSPTTLFRGVFGAVGNRAAVRSSALKQFGLMEGSDKQGYAATRLAVQITTSPPDEIVAFLREACLRPKVFGVLFETFHGDEVSAAKLRQQAADAKVHPDELENCIENFVASAVFAGLARRTGDQIEFVAARDVALSRPTPNDRDHAGADSGTVPNDVEESISESVDEQTDGAQPPPAQEGTLGRQGHTRDRRDTRDEMTQPSARSIIHVNVTVDSSLDTEKLEKHLTLLRRFGAI